MSIRLIDDSPKAPTAISQRVRALEGIPAGSLLVHEIYRSLQGEGSFTGLPCVFVRLSVCHLRCSYCDTAHAFHKGRVMTLGEVVDRVLEHGCPVVEVTGGEPLLQSDSLDLMTRLSDEGLTVLLETSGALSIEKVDPRVRIILDFKTPASGEESANLWSNLSWVKPTDEIKFVICDREDFDWMIETIDRHDLQNRCSLLVSPVQDRVSPNELAAWILESRRNLRLQVQLHKILWGPKATGV